jgi:iron(III) transport system substrate-binding protein
MRNFRLLAVSAAILAGVSGAAFASGDMEPKEETPVAATGAELNIYSYRESGLIQPLIDRFTAETGITVKVLYSGDGLNERVAAEGELSPADLVLTVDVGNLVGAKEQGLTQTITTPEVAERLAPEYRDADGQWAALSLRARVFYVSKDRVSDTALAYEDITKPEWKGRICTRPGDHPYNIGLIANRIAAWGLDKTRVWLAGVRDNLVSAPKGGDRDQVKAIFEGTCDLAIGNTYYMGVMLTNEAEPEQKDWANSARIIYPDANGDGTQVNAAGAYIPKYAPHVAEANAMIDFLLSNEAQEMYVGANYEFPAVAGVEPSPLIASWGKLNPSKVSLNDTAAHRKEAADLVDELKFNEGPQN